MTLNKAFGIVIKKLYRFGKLRYDYILVFSIIEDIYPDIDFTRSDLEWLYTKYINDLNCKYL